MRPVTAHLPSNRRVSCLNLASAPIAQPWLWMGPKPDERLPPRLANYRSGFGNAHTFHQTYSGPGMTVCNPRSKASSDSTDRGIERVELDLR